MCIKPVKVPNCWNWAQPSRAHRNGMLGISVPLRGGTCGGRRYLPLEIIEWLWANMGFSNHARERQCPKRRRKDQEELWKRQKEGAAAEGRVPERDPAVKAGRALPQGTQSGFGKM